MEVTVLEAVHPPSRPVLAVHAGKVRRQAKLEVDQSFVLPHPGEQSCAVEVTLFQQLASELLPHQDGLSGAEAKEEAICSIPVKKPDGSSGQVKLRVRRGGAAPQTVVDKPQPTSKTAARAAADGKLGVDEDPNATRDYLEKHQLQFKIQSLIQDVLKEQPGDPYEYMVRQLKASRAPVEPFPPNGPKPQGRLSARTLRLLQEDPRAIAKRSFNLLLTMPACQEIGESSIRDEVQVVFATRLTESVLDEVRQKVVGEAAKPKPKVPRRPSQLMSMQTEGTPEHKKARCTVVRMMVYRGACRLISSNEEVKNAVFEDYSSLPVCITDCLTVSPNWASWLR
eukprot:TRINITY_DN25145_c0_g1_i1.p1 TRINITY_DN25145_c0_g1~~TRINITY_DN25145_c0_g1_i1.p1  ORF type:complete len:339 (+),score=80.27 TRINITY_DN25145_c0_g1_i1:130-1146(+)